MALTSPLFGMFGRSPIRPLQQHMDKAYLCVAELLPFCNAVLAKDWDTAGQIQQRIVALERTADDLKKDLRLHLPTGLFLPVPRTDILTLLTHQDRLANKAEDIAGLIIGRRLYIPENLATHYQLFLTRGVEAADQARKAINELNELLESGFRGSEVKLIENMIVKLDEIEQDTDQQQVIIRKKLFDVEQDLPPVEVMFLYKLIEWTGELADRAQTVGGQLQLLLAH